eukprot:4672458-Lingulodinium_polyedra.AAC.1
MERANGSRTTAALKRERSANTTRRSVHEQPRAACSRTELEQPQRTRVRAALVWCGVFGLLRAALGNSRLR